MEGAQPPAHSEWHTYDVRRVPLQRRALTSRRPLCSSVFGSPSSGRSSPRTTACHQGGPTSRSEGAGATLGTPWSTNLVIHCGCGLHRVDKVTARVELPGHRLRGARRMVRRPPPPARRRRLRHTRSHLRQEGMGDQCSHQPHADSAVITEESSAEDNTRPAASERTPSHCRWARPSYLVN